MSNDSSSELEVAGAHEIEHALRRSDTDPRAAQRAERQVAIMFVGSVLASILFVVAFVSVKSTAVVDLPLIGRIGLQNLTLGVASGLGLFLIGAGAIHWARKLMPGNEVVAIKEGDSVLYDKNAGFKLLIEGRQYLVILERDVVVVL